MFAGIRTACLCGCLTLAVGYGADTPAPPPPPLEVPAPAVKPSSSAPVAHAFAVDDPPAAAAGGAKPADTLPDRHWVALWQNNFAGRENLPFNPERMSAGVAVDRVTGEVFLSLWNDGIWNSADDGKSFARVDGGKISGNGCGPIQGNSFYAAPAGSRLISFNMNNGPGPSGCSVDGGKTWTAFAAVGRNWDFGAMDFESQTVLAARHEESGLHLSTDNGQTWSQLERTRTEPWLTGLGVSGAALLIASDHRIERSEDHGKTWSTVADFGAIGPVVRLEKKLYWLAPETSARVLVSVDEGKTWVTQGKPAPGNAVLGPFFGKDARHIVVVGSDGFYETTDGAETWKLAVQLPADFSVGHKMAGAAYDPVHDTFYLTNWGQPILQFARARAAWYAEPAPVFQDPAATAANNPVFAQVTARAKAKVRCMVNNGLDLHGNTLYIAGEDGLMYFTRDTGTGALHFEKQLLEEKSGGFMLRCAGGRLYGVTPHDGYRRMQWHGLAWWELDPQTGAPEKKGVVDCPGSRQMLADAAGKNLYLKGARNHADKLYWFKLGADGQPEKAGETSGVGIGAGFNDDYPGILVMAPDEKYLYAVAANDYAIALIERQADGSIAWKSSTPLTAVAAKIEGNDKFLWVSIGLSPDGKYLYAAIRNGKPSENGYGIFTRDPASGALTFREKFSGETDALANLKGWNLQFNAAQTGGYLGSFIGPLTTFRYDPATGRLTDPRVVAATKGNGCSLLALDLAAGCLYTAGREYGYDGVFVVKLARPPQ